jgi:hypothetical protein
VKRFVLPLVVLGCSPSHAPAAASLPPLPTPTSAADASAPPAVAIDASSDASDAAEDRVDLDVAPDPARVHFATGPLTPAIDARFVRDKRPLPSGFWLRFQILKTYADDVELDMYVRGDGKVYFPSELDAGLPTDAEVTLDPREQSALTRCLAAARFMQQDAYQAPPPNEGYTTYNSCSRGYGTKYVVTARLGGREHEVIYDDYDSDVVKCAMRVERELEQLLDAQDACHGGL